MLTTGEVAKLFQVSAQTVINWLDQGRMPYERIGRGPRRLTEETVINYIKEIGISPTALDQSIYEKLMRRLYSVNGNSKSAAIVIINPDFHILAWNDEAKNLTGLSNMETLGKPLGDLLVSAQPGETLEQALSQSWNGHALDVSAVYTKKDGNKLPLVLTVSKFFAQGKMAGYAMVLHNPS